MWLWILLATIIFFLPELFPAQTLKIVRKVLKKIREDYARENGYDEMIKAIGPVEWWEDQPEVNK